MNGFFVDKWNKRLKAERDICFTALQLQPLLSFHFQNVQRPPTATCTSAKAHGHLIEEVLEQGAQPGVPPFLFC
jgi:hypothetical protein